MGVERIMCGRVRVFLFVCALTAVRAFLFSHPRVLIPFSREKELALWRRTMKMSTTDKTPQVTGNYKGTFVGKYKGDMKLQKMEGIKDRANYLSDPLKDEINNDEIFVSGDAVVVLKYHGSYMQDNREQRKKGEEKKYSFMLRLKSPGGEIPPTLYRTIDDLSRERSRGSARDDTSSLADTWHFKGKSEGGDFKYNQSWLEHYWSMR